MLALCFAAITSPAPGADSVPTVEVKLNWSAVECVSKTSPTLQVVVNPLLRPASPIHDQAFDALRNLRADYARFVPWYPYPRLGVAELRPPERHRTFWEFSLIDPLVLDFFHASAGRAVVLNFSTIPQWMFTPAGPADIPADPNQVVWNYEQSTNLRDPSMKEVADYFARVVSWYTQGGFTDELGQRHESGHHFKIDYWEILNEPEYEHSLTPQTYTRLYDAVAIGIRRVAPQTKFVGMSLATPSKSPEFFEYFLDARNHLPGVPLDAISYHFYALPASDQAPDSDFDPFTLFEQADHFLDTVRYIESIRRHLSPNTRTMLNEIGTIGAGDLGPRASFSGVGLSPAYWSLSGAVYAYLYAELTKLGIDVVGESQLVGFPSQYPSVSMIDWKTGRPNARYLVLKILRDNFSPGDKLVATTFQSPAVYAQGFLTPAGERRILLVNRRNHVADVLLPGAARGHMVMADEKTDVKPNESTAPSDSSDSKFGGPVPTELTSDHVALPAFAVAIVTLPD